MAKDFQVEDFPSGYRERFDELKDRVMDSSEKIFHVAEEFDMGEVKVWNNNGIVVSIQRMTPEEIKILEKYGR